MTVIEQERAQASARTRTETLAEILLSQLTAKFTDVPQERVDAVRKASDDDLNQRLIQLPNARTTLRCSLTGSADGLFAL